MDRIEQKQAARWFELLHACHVGPALYYQAWTAYT